MIESTRSRWRDRSTYSYGALVILLLAASYPPLYFSASNLYRFNWEAGSFQDSDLEKLQLLNEPAYLVTRWVNRNLKSDDAILVFRQSDIAFYSSDRIRRIYSDFDPVVLELFTEATKSGIVDRMRTLGISHVVTPNYSIPSIYNTEMQALLADHALTSLLFDRGAKIYQVVSTNEDPRNIEWIKDWDFSGELLKNEEWTYWQYELGLSNYPMFVQQREIEVSGIVSLSLLRDDERRSTLFYTGRGMLDVAPDYSFSSLNLHSDKSYIFGLNFQGSGQIDAHLVQYSKDGDLIGRKYLWGIVLTDERERNMTAMFNLDPQVASARILIEVSENSQLHPIRAKLGEIVGNKDNRDTGQRSISGWSVQLYGSGEDLGAVSDWGMSSNSVYLVQSGSVAEVLESPDILMEKSQGFCLTLKGRGMMNFSVAFPNDCKLSSCPYLEGDFGNFLLKNTATNLTLRFNQAKWEENTEEIETNPFARLNGVNAKLRFRLNSDQRYSGTEHVFGMVEILDIHHLGWDGQCESVNLLTRQ